MANVFYSVRRFMEASGQTTNGYNKEQAELYEKLVFEELQEWKDAKGDHGYHPIDDLDAVCDLIWVLSGYAYSMGYRPDAAFAEVARSNMDKIDPETGAVKRREDGKILKPDGWRGPMLAPYIS